MRPQRIEVEAGLQARVLAPYKPACRYLLRSSVESAPPGSEHLVRIRGELGIPSSCYIEDTGHFNSVEFNLCYNQLVYTLMAQCVASALVPALGSLTLEEYFERQLPDVLIHEFQSKFRRPLDPRTFRGSVEIVAAHERRAFIVLETRCAFEDDHGGAAHGAVTLAIVRRATHAHGEAADAARRLD